MLAAVTGDTTDGAVVFTGVIFGPFAGKEIIPNWDLGKSAGARRNQIQIGSNRSFKNSPTN